MEEYKDVNWSVAFEVTVNGVTTKFEDLPEDIKDQILKNIKEDYYSGTFCC